MTHLLDLSLSHCGLENMHQTWIGNGHEPVCVMELLREFLDLVGDFRCLDPDEVYLLDSERNLQM